VHTPELVTIDDSCELLPCPIAIYGRVHGEMLESLELSPPQAGESVAGALARASPTSRGGPPMMLIRRCLRLDRSPIRASWWMLMPRQAGSV
jgi:hypothetical protein